MVPVPIGRNLKFYSEKFKVISPGKTFTAPAILKVEITKFKLNILFAISNASEKISGNIMLIFHPSPPTNTNETLGVSR